MLPKLKPIKLWVKVIKIFNYANPKGIFVYYFKRKKEVAMQKIPVPVLWDKEYNFLNSSLCSVDARSVVVTTVLLPNKVYPPKSTPIFQSCLQINEPDFGTLYLNMPLSAYQAAIRAASASPEPLITTKIYHPVVSGATITDPALQGATIVAAWIGGIDVDVTGLLTGDVLTFQQDLNGSTVGVTFYTN